MLVWILACAAPSPSAHAQPALRSADDLARAGAQARAQRVPVLIAFTQTDCPFCAKAIGRYLIPLTASPAWQQRVMTREVDIHSTAPLRDFAGRGTTHRDFARTLGITRVPTLIAFDDRGEPLGERLVGLNEDFYGFYLERLIETAWQALQTRS